MPFPPQLQSRRVTPKTDRDLTRLAGVLLAFVFMLTAVAVDGMINRDGILYLDTASAYLSGGLKAATQTYPWPAYPIVIAELARLTGLSLEHAAYMLNGICLALLIDGFVRLCQLIDPNGHRGWLPLMLVLALPFIDDRLQIIREWGYLAFALQGFVQLGRFSLAPHGSLGQALLWQVSIGIATLFRVEACVFMVFAPLALLAQDRPWSARIRRWFLASCGVVPALSLLLTLTLIGSLPASRVIELAHFGNPLIVWDIFSTQADSLSNAILNQYSKDLAGLILGAGLLAATAYMTLANLAPGLLVVGGLSLFRNRASCSSVAGLTLWLIMINTLMLLIFLVFSPITVNRYALLSSILLLALLSPGIGATLKAGSNAAATGFEPVRRHGTTLILAGMVLANLIVLPDSKAYIREVGGWIHDNIPATETVLTNDSRIQYYAQRPRGNGLVRTVPLIEEALRATPAPYYLALRLDNERSTDLAGRLHCLNRIRLFQSHKGREGVHIFHVEQPPSGWKADGALCPGQP